MRKLLLLLFLILFIIPVSAHASDCNDSGFTVIYVNGILTNKDAAKKDKDLLEKLFISRTKRTDTDFINGFNPSHLAGAGDVLDSMMQAYGDTSVDYDLTNILGQVNSKL